MCCELYEELLDLIGLIYEQKETVCPELLFNSGLATVTLGGRLPCSSESGVEGMKESSAYTRDMAEKWTTLRTQRRRYDRVLRCEWVYGSFPRGLEV